MLLLIIFSFIAGIVTILSPCILPVLPIVLSGAIGGKFKPYGIVLGFTLSFVFFTLLLSTLVTITGISADVLRVFSIVIVFIFGLSLLISPIQIFVEKLFSQISSRTNTNNNKTGFLGGILTGISLGLLWTPCVGPILASVISLALTGSVSGSAFVITLSYTLGTAIPMLLICLTGRKLLNAFPFLVKKSGMIQKGFGIVMIFISLALLFNVDRSFQTFFLEKFPNYGTGLTKIEDNPIVRNALKTIQKNPPEESGIGKPMNTLEENRFITAPDFIPGGEWINSPALSITDLKGKVVLVDFWTYTCINCIRTLPYLREWNEKYKDKGLVIIGVHTPEFEFEKNINNVRKAVIDFKLTYPIMQDNNYATWNAYNNQYWPAKYFIDKNGKIRYTHFGEGEYDQSEKWIQELLQETGENVTSTPISNPSYTIQTQTPEIYLGYDRLQYLSSPETPLLNQEVRYSVPRPLLLNTFAIRGNWTFGNEHSIPTSESVLWIHFQAKDVYLVMRPKDPTRVAKSSVHLDGLNNPLSTNNAGKDVKESEIVVDSDRLYHLISLPKSEDHTLLLEFEDDNMELYAFTFG